MRKRIAFFICVALLFSGDFSAALAGQQGSSSQGSSSKVDGKPKVAAKNGGSSSSQSVAKTQFMRETGYRNGRPGYVVAYRKPLACGGADDPSNLEWLTAAEARTKDKTDRKGCK
jgi:hypothetical protein